MSLFCIISKKVGFINKLSDYMQLNNYYIKNKVNKLCYINLNHIYLKNN